ncbi:MAG: hypothetical protein JWP89_2921 [Schlesneria sp.]|nr:hypothetical protein [Schlesneria sp.]
MTAHGCGEQRNQALIFATAAAGVDIIAFAAGTFHGGLEGASLPAFKFSSTESASDLYESANYLPISELTLLQTFFRPAGQLLTVTGN